MSEPIVFRSQDQDIIIEFQKEKVNRVFSFAKTDEEDRYLYTMILTNVRNILYLFRRMNMKKKKLHTEGGKLWVDIN